MIKNTLKASFLLVVLCALSLSTYAAPVGGSVVVKSTSAASDSVCAGSNSKTLKLQGYFGTIVRWEYSATGNNPWTTIANTSDEYTVTNMTSSLYFRAVLEDAGAFANSDSVYIRVDQKSNSGSLTGDNTVCSGTNSGQVDLNGNTGRVISWMFSFNQGGSWTNNAGVTSSNVVYSNLTQTTWYRTIVKNGACDQDTSNIVKVNVSAATVAGSALIGGSNSTSVCSGDNSGTVALSGNTGSVISWEKSNASTGPWTQVFNNTTSIAFSNLTATTYYRAIVSNSPCDTLRSAIMTVSVDQGSDGGSISGDVVQCSGSNSGTLNLTGHSGSVQNWLSSTDSSNWVIVSNVSANYAYSNLSDTTWFRAIVKNGTCGSDTSVAVRVDVNATSVGGTLNSTIVCTQNNSGTINLSGNTGEVLRWETASNSGGPWSSIVNTTSALSFSNLLSTTYYRAVVQSPGCNVVYSSTSTVQVDPLSNAGTVSGNSSACETSNSFTLSSAGNVGTAVDWITSTNNGSTWASSSNANASLAVTNQSAETWYRYISKSGVCSNDTSAVHKVTSDPVSVGGTMAGTATVCSGSNSGTLSLSGNTGTIIRWETAVNANGPWSGVTHTSASLPYSNLTNSIYYRAVVKSGECAEVSSDSAYVKVEPQLAGGSIAGSGEGCEGENSGVMTLNNYGGTISKWQYSVDSGSSWTDTVTSARTLAYSNLLKTTLYRVQVEAGVCGSTFSDTATITIYSEPVVNFTAPQTCQNVAVVFNNQTINGKNNQFTWAYGDGNSSNLQNPNYKYASHGNFNVTLTALSSDNCSASLTKQITIDSVPNLAYTSSNVCQGKSVELTNSTTPSGGTSSWNYGDGASASSYSTTYTYASHGTYDCKLTYTAPNGCIDSLIKTVEIYPQPKATFTNPTVAEKQSFSFTNSSSVVSGSIGYQWNFGDGNSSIVQNPTHTFSDTGAYTVQLISFNQNCRDTLEKVIVANPTPSPAFSTSSRCQGDSTLFTNTSFIKKGGMTFKWNFDDGSTSTDSIPKHRFAAPGNYKVELEATSDSGFVTTLVQNVNIDPLPVPNFNASSACEGDTTEFKNLSTINGGTISHIWNFGIGGAGATSTDSKYSYSTGGSYAVKLTVTSGKGCIDSLTVNVPVYYRPDVKWGTDTICEGDATQFTDSTSVQGGRAVGFNWDFGTKNGSGVQNPTYTYNKYGTYIAKLLVTSDKGCVDSLVKNVVVNPLPVPIYSASNTCQRDSLNFTSTSYHPLSSPFTYRWKFGTGDTSVTSSPRYAYANSGSYNPKLIVIDTATGCADSVSHALSIHPRSVPAFVANGACLGSTTQFSNNSSVSNGNLSYNWDFGDLNSSTLNSPSHTYAQSGNYNVRLQVSTNQNCVDTLTKVVYVYPQPAAKFAVNSVCKGDSIAINNTSTYTTGAAIPDSTITYYWDFGDGDTAIGKSPRHLYLNSGNYRIELSVKTDSGCVSSTMKNVNVYTLPIADFDAKNACAYDSVEFKNQSNSVYGNLSSIWYFGDLNNSSDDSPNHKYAQWGTYNIKLEVTDIYGCIDTIVKSAQVYPVPVASYETQNVCDGERSSFSDSSTIAQGSIDDWNWIFGDGTGSILQNPTHQFLNDGAYTVGLKVTSDQGCSDDTTMAYLIYPLPIANFTLGKTCLNDPLPLVNDAGIKAGTITYKYNFSDGSSYQTAEPVHTPEVAEAISLTQIVTSDFGCQDSITRDSEVWSLPEVVAEKDTIVSYGLGFRLKASGAENYLWENAQGLDDIRSAEPLFDAFLSQDFVVVGTDENGCKTRDTVTVEVVEDFQVFPSEIITPDGNGFNDTWVVKNAENYSAVRVQVVDRWGNTVFEEQAYKNTWTGINKNNDILPDGTYYYIVSFEGSARIYKGALTIIRNNK